MRILWPNLGKYFLYANKISSILRYSHLERPWRCKCSGSRCGWPLSLSEGNPGRRRRRMGLPVRGRVRSPPGYASRSPTPCRTPCGLPLRNSFNKESGRAAGLVPAGRTAGLKPAARSGQDLPDKQQRASRRRAQNPPFGRPARRVILN